MKRIMIIGLITLLSVMAAYAEEAFLHDCIVYSEKESIRVVNLDGTGDRVLANALSFYNPQIAPDGRSIVFRGGGKYKFCITLLDLDSFEFTELVSGERPSFSPKGDRILFETEPTSKDTNVHLMKLDGTEQVVLADGLFPSFSSDGKSIAFSKRIENNYMVLCIMNADGSNVRRIGKGIQPHFASNNQMIMYNSTARDNAYHLIDLSGNEIYTLKNAGSYSISNDSTKVAYSELRGNNCFIHILDLNTMTDKVMLEGYHPVFSPDGKKLIYCCYIKISDHPHISLNEIHILNIDGTEDVKLAEGYMPIVAPMLIDGRLLDTYGNWHDVR